MSGGSVGGVVRAWGWGRVWGKGGWALGCPPSSTAGRAWCILNMWSGVCMVLQGSQITTFGMRDFGALRIMEGSNT